MTRQAMLARPRTLLAAGLGTERILTDDSRGVYLR